MTSGMLKNAPACRQAGICCVFSRMPDLTAKKFNHTHFVIEFSTDLFYLS
jgi:hypothetical protein